uniref:Uncharacterized protein n=2 Tax=root TaxID=1 RepID=A0A8S5QEZ7_9CAUD|nr:MAG TPA: hypothetical protein [Siphoviridae sp. ctoOf8]
MNGHALDWAVIDRINEELKIEVPVVSAGTN